jgi:Zn finger protein HypA/HybF involved in hydrogenase expression
MITDTFEHVQDIGEDEAQLRCKECNRYFMANFNILLPRHVEYDLDENMKMTVTCPECKTQAKVSQEEYRLTMTLTELETKRDALVQELREKLQKIDLKFMIKGDRFGQGFAIFDCLKCGTEFEARTGTHPDGRLNVRVNERDFALVCPNCGVEDQIDDSNVKFRAQVSLLNQVIRGLNDKIGELKSELAELTEKDDE